LASPLFQPANNRRDTEQSHIIGIEWFVHIIERKTRLMQTNGPAGLTASRDHGGDGRVRAAAALISPGEPPLPLRLPDRDSPLRSLSVPPAGLRCCCRCSRSRAPSCRCRSSRSLFSRARRGRRSALVARPPSPPPPGWASRRSPSSKAWSYGCRALYSSSSATAAWRPSALPVQADGLLLRAEAAPLLLPKPPCSSDKHAAAGASLRFAPCAPCC
jgi:hypothetical protein